MSIPALGDRAVLDVPPDGRFSRHVLSLRRVGDGVEAHTLIKKKTLLYKIY